MRQAEAQHMPTESAQAEIIKEKYTILSLQVLYGLLFSADFAWIFFQSFFNNFNVVSEFFSLCGARSALTAPCQSIFARMVETLYIFDK